MHKGSFTKRILRTQEHVYSGVPACASYHCAGPRPRLKTQTAGLCRLCFVSAGQRCGRGGGRDLFAWRYTGYGRSQGVVTPSFFKVKERTRLKESKPRGRNIPPPQQRK